MTTKALFQASLAIAALFGAAACSNMEFTHVKPGQSARAALTARNAPPAAVPVNVSVEGGLPTPAEPSSANFAATGPLEPLPAPALPDGNNVGENVADLYTRGSLSMQAGRNAEAISALEKAVELDPNFSDAWSKLVILYQREGQDAKSIAAYKKAKKLGQPNGPTNALPVTGGLFRSVSISRFGLTRLRPSHGLCAALTAFALLWQTLAAPPPPPNSPSQPPMIAGDLVRVTKGEMLQFNGKNLVRVPKKGEFSIFKEERGLVFVAFLKEDGTLIAATLPRDAVEPLPSEPGVELRKALESFRSVKANEVRQHLLRAVVDPQTKVLAATLSLKVNGALTALQTAESARTPAAYQALTNTLVALRESAAALAQAGLLSLAVPLDEGIDQIHTRAFGQTRPFPPAKIQREDLARRAAVAERAVLETRQAFALRHLVAGKKSLEVGLQAEPERAELKAFQIRLHRDLEEADDCYRVAEKMRTRGEKGVIHALSALDDGLRLCADHAPLLALRKDMQAAYDLRTAPPISPALLAAVKTPSPALEEGRQLYTSRCTECHDLEMLETRGLSAWQKTVGGMSRRANLTNAEQTRILEYLAAAVAAGEKEQ